MSRSEPANEALCDSLAALHSASFTTPRPWSSTEFAGLLAMKDTFLAQANTSAFALGRVVLDEAELLTVAVAPTARGQGLGRAALAQYEADAVKRGATVSFLEVAATNEVAIALYRSSGYEQTGRRPRYYRQPDDTFCDALIFSKSLKEA